MVPEAVLNALAQRFGARANWSAPIRAAHGRDESWHHEAPPDVVVWPKSTEEAAFAVTLCAQHNTPVIAFGAGTSLEGHVGAVRGDVCLDMTQMNRVIEVNAADMDCRVEAGLTRKALNAHLRDTGLFFPIDPGADATLGGMTATRASGTNAVRYGTMRENVLSLTVVLADGHVIRTAQRARKSSAGYDLTRLFVGSEGTLGVITEIGLRLYGAPERIESGLISFETVADAVNTVIATLQYGLPIARIELLDAPMIAACNAYSKLSLAVRPTLFVEFHGTPAAVSEQVEYFRSIASAHNSGPLETSTDPGARNKLWAARHDAYYAARALAPGKSAMVSDVCVPISRLAEMIVATQDDLQAAGVQAPLAGHVGDGNFHLIMLFDPDDAAEFTRVRDLHDRMISRAIAMNGTCTGEHGIGAGKMRFLAQELGEAVPLMRAIKSAFDPQGILNPGKIFS